MLNVFTYFLYLLKYQCGRGSIQFSTRAGSCRARCFRELLTFRFYIHSLLKNLKGIDYRSILFSRGFTGMAVRF
jgi:hypothetical protein